MEQSGEWFDNETWQFLGVIASGCLLLGLVLGISYYSQGGSPSDRQFEREYQLDRARKLFRNERYSDALEAYKATFLNSADDPSMRGVRLSYVLMEMKQLGKHHPPALEVLKNWRDERKTHVLNESAEFRELHELTALNRALGNTMATFDTFNELVEAESKWADRYVSLTWKQFVRHDRVDQLEPFIESLVRSEARRMARMEQPYDRPEMVGVAGERRANYRRGIKRQLKRRCGVLFEALEQLDRGDLKTNVKDQLNHPEFCETTSDSGPEAFPTY